MDQAELLKEIGYQPLNRTWAKAEIILGLTAAGAGLFLERLMGPGAASGQWLSLLLFVLGGYLTLAGHRSHLYQSSNELTAHLLGEIRRTKEKAS